MKVIEVQEFILRFKNLIENNNAKFCFFLGAGCSVSSGIDMAGTLIDKVWLPKLKYFETGNQENFDEWLGNRFPEYNMNNSAQLYGEIIESLFPTPKERQIEIERLVKDCYPGFCYAILAKLMEKYGAQCNIILTTNFDDMIADALYLYTDQKPIVIFHEALAAFVKISDARPMVIKLHGDSKLFPLNTNEETEELSTEFKRIIKNLFSEKGLIFIGYGGNDSSINNILDEIPINEGFFPWGIYWVGKNIRNEKMKKFLEEKNALWVNHTNFDELMLLMKEALELELPTKDKFDVFFNNLSNSLSNLTVAIHAKSDSDEKEHLKKAARKASKELKISIDPEIFPRILPSVDLQDTIPSVDLQDTIPSVDTKFLPFTSSSVDPKISQGLTAYIDPKILRGLSVDPKISQGLTAYIDTKILRGLSVDPKILRGLSVDPKISQGLTAYIETKIFPFIRSCVDPDILPGVKKIKESEE